MVKLLGLGDNVCDVYLHTRTMYPGGQAVNVAVYAKGLGADSAFLGVHGNDAVAAHVLATLDEKGVDHSRSRQFEGENGFACVSLVEGDRVFMGSNKGGIIQQHPIVLDEADLAYIKGFDVVHTTNNGFLDGELPKLKGLGPLVSYDFSGRWVEEDRQDRVCPYIDFGLVSCGDLPEEMVLELCHKLHNKGCGVVLATRGSEGAFVYDGTTVFRQPPKLVKPVDTMGAGDSFAANTLVKVAEVLERDGREKWADPVYRAHVMPAILESSAEYSAKNCLVHGAFDCGVGVPPSMYARIAELTGVVL
ncbi:MAG: PfkB family carbohydrate kinase [Pygmaiobacter massiliensis]|nr:PfkB family carbohydrate kinase [Pygmaiobacter massiliensis]